MTITPRTKVLRIDSRGTLRFHRFTRTIRPDVNDKGYFSWKGYHYVVASFVKGF